MSADTQTWQQPPAITAVQVPYEPDPDAEVIEGEAVDNDVPAHTNPAPYKIREGHTPRQVFPEWVKDWGTFKEAVKYEAHCALKWLAFHAARLPLYFVRLLLLSPRGTGRLIGGWMRWLVDAEGRELRRNAASGPGIDPGVLFRLIDQRRKMLGNRGLLSAVMGAIALSCVYSFISYTNALGFTLATALVACTLGWLGRDQEHHVVDSTGDSELPRLTLDLFITALGALGITPLTQALKNDGPRAVRVVSPLGHSGPGFQVVLALPPGVPASDIVKLRDKLAAGLGRPAAAVWPSTDPDRAANELTVFVANQPLSQMKAVPWPYEKTGQTSVFAPFPIGVDPRGRAVPLTLMFTNGVCGAIPRKGKTMSLRLMALGAALDPTCELHLFDCKGGGDWRPLERVAYRFRSGIADEDMDYVLEDLRVLAKVEMPRRYKTLNGLPAAVCPDSKTTPELAADRSLGLWPILVIVDETQVIFTDQKRGKEFKEYVRDLVTRGPAAGIMIYVATQRVCQETIPTIISAMAIVRLCLKVNDYRDSNLVLGNVSSQGYNAATFGPHDDGIAYFAGEGDVPIVVRFPKIDGPMAERIADRARAIRKARGMLNGYCVDGHLDDPDDLLVTPLQHLLDVWPGQDARASFADLAERLSERHPDVYAGWTTEQVSSIVRGAGLKVVQVNREGRNARGVALSAVREAVEPKDREPDTPRVEPTWPEPQSDGE